MQKKNFAFSLALSAGLALTSCADYEVAERGIAINKAFENAHNSLMLLNVVRASKRYPMHFTTFQQVTYTPHPELTFGFDFPLKDGSDAFNFKPTLGIDPGFATVIQPLDKHEFYRGILRPVDLDLVWFYFTQGWPPALLWHVFVERIEITGGNLVPEFREGLENFCQSPLDNTKDKMAVPRTLCDVSWSTERYGRRDQGGVEAELPLQLGDCRTYWKTDTAILRLINDPGEKRCFDQYRRFVYMLFLLQIEASAIPEESSKKTTLERVTGDTNTEKNIFEFQIGTVLQVQFCKNAACTQKINANGNIVRQLNTAGESDPSSGVALGPVQSLDTRRAEELEGDIKVWLRSAQGVIFYLGELMNAGFEEPKGSIEIFDVFDGGFEPLFFVKKGVPNNPSVSVTHENETYWIPKSEGRKTMQLLSLATQLINLSKDAKELPGTQNVNIVGGGS